MSFILMLCLTLKTTRPTQNEQKNDRQNANASAKSKELHPNAQSQHNAAHLLLPQRTNLIVKHFRKWNKETYLAISYLLQITIN